MDVARRLHVGEDVILEFGNGLEGVGHVLVLLDVADDLGGFGAFGEIDEVGAFEDGGDAVFDEGEVGEVDACGFPVLATRGARFEENEEWSSSLPKKGMQGGLARCSVSRYSAKFFVLPMSLRIVSRTLDVRAFTCAQVRLRRSIGAVPNADMMDVNVEKLLRARHFCRH